MKERTILQTTLTETAFQEILRESFQDFDLLDYKYSLYVRTGIRETNNDGSLKLADYNCYKDYEQFYSYRVGKKIKVTYKYYIGLELRFTHNGILNKLEFDDFFEDGLIKLNYLLEKYNIEIPFKNIAEMPYHILRYDEEFKDFMFSYYMYGEEFQLPSK